MAPEVINILNQEVANPNKVDVHSFPDFYDLRCDIWSLGVCIHTLLEGELPYDMEDMSKFIAEGTLLPKLKSSASPWAADFVKQCLLIDFRVRPGAKGLLTHCWLADTDHQCGPTPHSSSTIASRLRAFSKLSKFKRAALLAAARHLGSYEHEELRCIFQKVDVHHQGEVPLTDLMEYLTFAPASPSSGHQWVAEAVKVLDAQCKGVGVESTDHDVKTCTFHAGTGHIQSKSLKTRSGFPSFFLAAPDGPEVSSFQIFVAFPVALSRKHCLYRVFGCHHGSQYRRTKGFGAGGLSRLRFGWEWYHHLHGNGSGDLAIGFACWKRR